MQIDSDRIREFRELHHWTQQQLADASGLSLRTIQRIEKSGNASHESLLSLCATMDIEVKSLKVVPPKPSEAELQEVSTRPQVVALIAASFSGVVVGSLLTYMLIG